MGTKKKVKEKPVPGSDAFVFDNGDKYIGEYLAFKNETVYKHG